MTAVSAFNAVFALPELPPDSDSDIASNWLLNHEHKEPTQRIKAALKRCTEDGHMEKLLQHYTAQIRSEVALLDLSNIQQLERIRDYFLFPTGYLSLTDQEFIQLERTINAAIRSKVTSLHPLSAEEELFTISLGLDTTEVSRLNYHSSIVTKVQSFTGIWDRSLFSELNFEDDLTRSELSKLRCSEIFDIVIEYPATIPALQDLKRCMDPTQRSSLISSFTKATTERLLHAGANTNDIILCYTSTIKSFLIIDPRGVLLDNASRPIRRYLRDREDTIPTVVNALLDNNPEDPLSKLADELSLKSEKTTNNLTLDWHPDPIDALPDFRKQDIIESLISIYDNKEQFISELVSAFARKLLALKDFDISDSLTKLEQLKRKFEENELDNLDVMVRDIADSEEVDEYIHSTNVDVSDSVRFAILSYMYWPEFEETEFKLPPAVIQQMETYSEEYKNIKKGRTLRCLTAGIVQLELEFEKTTLKFSVSPEKAAVINCFDGDAPVQPSQIWEMLEMDPELAQSTLTFWEEEGIIMKTDNGYTIIEDQAARSTDIEETVDDSGSTALLRMFKPYWPFIVEMLTNLGPMEHTKIHTFLTAVVPKNLSYNEISTKDQLAQFLHLAVQEGSLSFNGGKFALKK